MAIAAASDIVSNSVEICANNSCDVECWATDNSCAAECSAGNSCAAEYSAGNSCAAECCASTGHIDATVTYGHCNSSCSSGKDSIIAAAFHS